MKLQPPNKCSLFKGSFAATLWPFAVVSQPPKCPHDSSIVTHTSFLLATTFWTTIAATHCTSSTHYSHTSNHPDHTSRPFEAIQTALFEAIQAASLCNHLQLSFTIFKDYFSANKHLLFSILINHFHCNNQLDPIEANLETSRDPWQKVCEVINSNRIIVYVLMYFCFEYHA